MNTNKYAIVYACDENIKYVKYLMNALISEYQIMNNLVDVFVIRIRKNEKQEHEILSKINSNIKFIYIDSFFKDYTVYDVVGSLSTGLTVMAFARLFIPIIHQLYDYNKVLYLDIDTEIKNNIFQLFNIKFDEQLLCVEDDFYSTLVQHIPQDRNTKTLKNAGYKSYDEIVGSYRYVNTGVTLFNIDVIHENKEYSEFVNSYKKMLDNMFIMQKKCDFVAKDQDLINLFFSIHVLKGTSEYNCFFHDFLQHKYSNPYIMHYILEIGKKTLEQIANINLNKLKINL